MGRPLWSSQLIEKMCLAEKEKELDRKRELEIREEEMSLLGWTSFVPLRESGLWGVAEGNVWSSSAPTAPSENTPRRSAASPNITPNHPLDCVVDNPVQISDLSNDLQITFSQEIRGEFSDALAQYH